MAEIHKPPMNFHKLRKFDKKEEVEEWIEGKTTEELREVWNADNKNMKTRMDDIKQVRKDITATQELLRQLHTYQVQLKKDHRLMQSEREALKNAIIAQGELPYKNKDGTYELPTNKKGEENDN